MANNTTPTPINTSVTAVVVTYNRKDLLIKCLDSISQQTLPLARTLVIDNASTDGTQEILLQASHSKSLHLNFLRIEENTGGAGGFNAGLEWALREQAGWIWIMDDDGIPEPDVLEHLYSHAVRHGYEAITPLHIDIEDHSKLAFPIWLATKHQVFEVAKLEKIDFIPNEANLFNGLLIHASVISKIGLPKKELFIRGDEVEYTKRMKHAKIRFCTLTSARFYHPSDIHERIPMFRGRLITRDAGSRFKNYYMFRNRAVAFVEDGNAWLLPIDFLRYSYYFLIHRKGDWPGLKLWAFATLDGLRGKLGRHPDF